MASVISSLGAGSGLDIQSIITSLTDAEQAPIKTRLDTQEAQVKAEISAFGVLSSALSDFQSSLTNLSSLQTLAARAATSSNPSSFTATATNSASVGSSQIEVVNLASADKLVSQNGYATPDTAVGAGTLNISVGSASFSVNIVGGQNNTLAGIRDAINSATDNAGVTASILTVSDGAGGTVSKLVLASNNTGAAGAISVSVTGDADGNNTDNAGLSSFAFDNATKTGNMDEKSLAQDALIRVDGYDVTSSNNTFTNAIQGVTITATTADPGVNQTLSVAVDQSAIQDNLNKFVTAYNKLFQSMQALTQYDPSTNQASPLTGDFAALTIQSQIRRTMSSVVSGLSGSFNSLASIGITTQRDGTLAIDSTKLNTALNSNFDEVTQMLAGSNGIAKNLSSTLDSFLGYNGLISTRNQTYQEQLKSIADQRTQLADHIKSYTAMLTQKYSAMDSLVGQLNSTQNYLSTQLSALTKSLTSSGK